jgi:hypothetical protein
MCILVGCRSTPTKNTNLTVTLNDSLYWKKTSGDSLIKIPGSYVPLVVLPDKLDVGEKKEEKKGQATVSVEKQEDGTLLVTASCDSLELKIQVLTEELTKVNKQNEQLQEEVKAAPNKWNWFWKGFTSGALIVLGIIILVLVKVFKNK